MSQKEQNRKTIKYIRKCQEILEDFGLCVEGYASVLDKTNQILANQNKLNISDKNNVFIISKASAINKKIIEWKSNIDKNPKNHLAIYFVKWLGFEYIYNLHNLYNRIFTYNNFQVKGSDVSHVANKYLKEIIRIQKEMNRARDFMMESNRKLIISVVQKTIGARQGLFDDILSVANIQFIKCMDETYDLSKNVEFSTYAYSCMQAKCREAIICYNDMISIPHYKMGERLISSRQEIETPEKNVDNLTVNLSIYSLDKMRDKEREENREDLFLSDGNVISEIQNQVILQDLIKEIIQNLIRINPKNEIKMKALEYRGFFDFKNDHGNLTLEEIAEKLYKKGYTDTRLTRERIRQIINEGVKSFKAYIKRDRNLMESFGL